MNLKNLSTNLLERIYTCAKIALSVSLPRTCILCSAPSIQDLDLCINCENELPWLINNCQQCGIALPHQNQESPLCGQCVIQPHAFDRSHVLFPYDIPIQSMVTQFKFHEKLIYIDILAKLLIKHLRNYYQEHALPEIIIPVPLHIKRLRQRGFNQALEIARPIAKSLNLGIENKLCKRIKYTRAQSELTADLRKKNVKDAFYITREHDYKHVAIVDDVLTTGATLNALSAALKASGVETIEVWCLARTV